MIHLSISINSVLSLLDPAFDSFTSGIEWIIKSVESCVLTDTFTQQRAGFKRFVQALSIVVTIVHLLCQSMLVMCHVWSSIDQTSLDIVGVTLTFTN